MKVSVKTRSGKELAKLSLKKDTTGLQLAQVYNYSSARASELSELIWCSAVGVGILQECQKVLSRAMHVHSGR